MKTFVYKLAVVVTLCLSVLFLSKGWQMITDGFRIDKIHTRLSPGPEPTDTTNLEKILSQKFYYLDKGCQTFVFESKDHQYVLKLVRYHKYKPAFWMQYLQLFSITDEYRKKRKAFRERSKKNTLHSYVLSYEKLSEETATTYIHLHKTTSFQKPLIIVDRLGRSYELPLNDIGFLLQRKGTPLISALLQAKNKQDLVKTGDIIHSFFQTVSSLYKKGIANKDYNCIKNAGVIDGKVVEIDLGSFYEQDLSTKEAFAKELFIFIKHFRKWGNKNYPEILPMLEKEYDKAIE
jgi:hypothetical protein